MREYLFISQMPKSYCRVLMNDIARALEVSAMYSGAAEHDYMQMHYVFGSVKLPGVESFYGAASRK